MSEHIPDHREENAEEPVIGDPPPRVHTLFSNKVYDILKWVAQVFLPALALFYISVAPFWGLPKQEEVAGTIVAFDLLLGTLLGLSSKQYLKATEGKLVGFMDVRETQEGKSVSLEFPGDPHDIDQHDKVTFKVRKR